MATSMATWVGAGLLLSNHRSVCFTKTRVPALHPLIKAKGLSSELGFVTSQLCGLKITHQESCCKHISSPTTTPTIVPIVARRICPFTGKKANTKNLVSFSNKKTKKKQFVNLQYKRVWWEEGKRFVKLRLSTKALKTIEKNGLDAVAKKAGIDLSKE